MLTYRLLQLALALAAHASTLNSRHETSIVTRQSAVLYQNDGNWTVGDLFWTIWKKILYWHVWSRVIQKPRALYYSSTLFRFLKRDKYAPRIVKLYFMHQILTSQYYIIANPCYLCWYHRFKIPLQYQNYLGNTGPETQFWTASSSDHSFSETRAFICTNTAPLVDKVETPFYLFPKANVSSNGTTYMGVRDHIAYRFLGIPYILQPVDNLRLAYPIQWYTNETSYVLNATTCKFFYW